MSDERLDNFLKALRDAYQSEQSSDLVSHFSLPLVIYTPAGVTLVRDAQQLLELTDQYRKAVESLNIASTEFQIEDEELPNNQRFRATVRFTDFSADHQKVTGSLIRYFLVRDGESFKIEMVEYLEMPLPFGDVERIVH